MNFRWMLSLSLLVVLTLIYPSNAIFLKKLKKFGGGGNFGGSYSGAHGSYGGGSFENVYYGGEHFSGGGGHVFKKPFGGGLGSWSHDDNYRPSYVQKPYGGGGKYYHSYGGQYSGSYGRKVQGGGYGPAPCLSPCQGQEYIGGGGGKFKSGW